MITVLKIFEGSIYSFTKLIVVIMNRANPSKVFNFIASFVGPVRSLNAVNSGAEFSSVSGTELRDHYRSGTVNSNTVNSKFHLIRSCCEYLARFLSFHV